MSFRLKWTFKQLIDLKGYSEHKAVLRSPWKYYVALIVKFIPGLYKKPIDFELVSGSTIKVEEFMSIFIYKEIFVDGCYDNLPVTNNKPVVIEVGANTGLFALRIKSTYPDAEVFSFEPHPRNYQALLSTIKLNGLENVNPIEKAVTDHSGKLKLFIHPTNIGGHSIFQKNAGEKNIEVESTNVDSILADNDISVCDILKLDCEGAEFAILKSLTKEIAKRIHCIIYEPTRSQYSVEELNLFLKELGYNIRYRQGLVIASIDVNTP